MYIYFIISALGIYPRVGGVESEQKGKKVKTRLARKSFRLKSDKYTLRPRGEKIFHVIHGTSNDYMHAPGPRVT